MFHKNRITAWSFSRYSAYSQCPLLCKLRNIDKIPEVVNPAMVRGAKIHDLARDYLQGKIAKLPIELGLQKKLFLALKNKIKASKQIFVEEQWAFTKDWVKTDWRNWGECFLRVKTDCAEVNGSFMEIFDWKTGRFRQEDAVTIYTEQLELYAMSGFLLYPQVNEIQAKLIYLDVKEKFSRPYFRSELPMLQKVWEKRTRAMLNDTRFAPRPNTKCMWCHYRSSNKTMGGGQCRF
jgi:hypothetical protein